MNRPVTRQTAGEINFHLSERNTRRKWFKWRIVCTTALTDTARSWTLRASTVLQTAATRCVYISTNAWSQRTLKSGSQTDGLDFLFLYSFPKRNSSSWMSIVKRRYRLTFLNQAKYVIHQIQERGWRLWYRSFCAHREDIWRSWGTAPLILNLRTK